MAYKHQKNNRLQQYISIFAIALIVSNIFVTTVSVNYVHAYNPFDDSTNPNISDPAVNPDGSPFDSSVQTPQVNADGSPVNINSPVPQINSGGGQQNPSQNWQRTEKTYRLLEPLPCLDNSIPGCEGGQIKNIDLGNFFQYAFNLLIALSAVAAVFMIVWGGFQYMTTDSWQQKTEGKEKFKNAIYGLLMVLGSFLILKTVNPKLVAIPPSIPPVRIDLIKTSPLSFFDKLNEEANQHRINTQEAITARNVARAAVETAQLTLDYINKQLSSIYDGTTNVTQEQINQLVARKNQLIDEINKKKSEASVQQVIKIIEQDLVSMATGANQNIIDSSTSIWAPGSGATKGSLDQLGSIANNINGQRLSKIKELNSIQNSNTPIDIQTINNKADDALLKTTQIYVETYNSERPTSVPGTQQGILRMNDFKNSFVLSNPQKNNQKNELIINLCRSEMVSIRLDPNLCK